MPDATTSQTGSRTAHARPRRSPQRALAVVLVGVGVALAVFGAVLGLAHRAATTDASTVVVLVAAAVATTAGCVAMELLDQRVTSAAALPPTAPSWSWALGLVGVLLLVGGLAAAPAVAVVGVVVLGVALVVAGLRWRVATTRRSTVTLLEGVGTQPGLEVRTQHIARGSRRVYLVRDGVLVADTVVASGADVDAVTAAAKA